jgi:Flp pilus assembly protein TadD
MREHTYQTEEPYSWIVYATATMILGLLVGYVLASQGNRAALPGATASPVAAATVATSPVVDEASLKAYREILERDPKNLAAATAAGNMLYDAHRYVEAIPFYQQAFALNAGDINVSTDLGTTLWYAGRADEALSQYDRSLAINPAHPQTLFNVGIVKAEGKHDYAGAIAAWEKLLATTPDYSNAANVRSLIEGAMEKQVR